MPIVPPAVTSPFDTANTVLNFARAYVNDMGLSVDGNLLSNPQPYTFVLLNSAWRKLQDRLMNSGVEVFPAEALVTNIPVVGSIDPATQAYLGYEGFFDGVTTFTTPVLPQDLVAPLRLWERQTATQQVMTDMFPVNDGLPARPKTQWLYEWEWRNQRLYFVGATFARDVRIRYNSYLADIAYSASGDSQIPIMRCAVALAHYLAAEFASARGSPLAVNQIAMGDDAVLEMVSSTTRKQQRGNHRRIPYSRRGNCNSGY